jgi:hypothetical protein
MEKQLELQKLENENALLKKKVEAIDSQMTSDAKYQEVLDAMKLYSGNRE